MGGVFSSLLSMFYSKKLDIVLIGLSGAGKSTFANSLALGNGLVETVPTVGLSVQTMKNQGVTCKIWDMGGQESFRMDWGRYARGCDVICVVVDTQRPQDLPVLKRELHRLLEDRELIRIPILLLANKIDLGPKIFEMEIIESLNLDYVMDNPWLIIPTSARYGDNVDKALEFLIKQSK